MKWAIWGAVLLSAFTLTILVRTLTAPDPTLDVARAAALFDRYPHWQRSVSASQEVAFDPALARQHAQRFASPKNLKDDPFLVWQPTRTSDIVLEFGVGGQMGNSIRMD